MRLRRWNWEFKGLTGVLILAALLVVSGCTGKTTPEKIAEPKLSPETPLAIAVDIEGMRSDLAWLSSEDSGRLAGTEGEDKVVDYLQERMQELGFDASVQSFPYSLFSVAAYKLSFENSGLPLLDGAVAPEDSRVFYYSTSTPPEGLQGQLVDLGMGLDSDYTDREVTGKIALIARGGEYFYLKVQRAYEHGAIATIFYDPKGTDAIQATLVRESKIPAIGLKTEIATGLVKELQNNSQVQANLSIDSSIKEVSSENVVALLEAPGDVKEKIVIGAHFDGVDTPAANDNGSGTAAVLELARLIQLQRDQLQLDVEFVFFGAEESGLIGSYHYVDQLVPAEIDQIKAMINLDMVGIGETLQLATTNGQALSTLASAFTAASAGLGMSFEPFDMGRSDHVPFTEVGIPAVMLTASPVDNYHTDDDTLDAIDWEVMKAQVTWVLAALKIEGMAGEGMPSVIR